MTKVRLTDVLCIASGWPSQRLVSEEVSNGATDMSGDEGRYDFSLNRPSRLG